MKLAIPHWQGRVSPVLDAAGGVLLVDAADGQEVQRAEIGLTSAGPLQRARELVNSGAETVICGAVSRPLEMALRGAGVQVVAYICGGVEEVLAAFLRGNLDQDAFLMPGCCRRRRGLCAGRRGGGQFRHRGRKGGDIDAAR